jgi:guanidinoacetate N-methyltransferase
MGISATYIQECGVQSHTIIECNDDVVRAFEKWKDRRPARDIRLIYGKWQDVVDRLGRYDGILFDTYPLDEDEFIAHVINSITFAEHFFPVAAQCLKEGGVFTYYTNEIDSFSRRHQRLLFKYFSSFTLSVVKPLSPPEDCNYWWADSMVVVKAIK